MCPPVFPALYLCVLAEFPQQTIQHDHDRAAGSLPGSLPRAALRGHTKVANPQVLRVLRCIKAGISLLAGAAQRDISVSGMGRRAAHPLCTQQPPRQMAAGGVINKSWDVQLS